MVILFLISGIAFGASAAAVTLWSGGSVLLAIASYSLFGTLGAMAVIYGVYLLSQARSLPDDWADPSNKNDPVSA